MKVLIACEDTRIDTVVSLPQTGPENRAKTFPGIAAAMAEQWGGDIR